MITRIVIKRRQPFAKGYKFPITGAYEKLVGKIYGEVDPRNRLNKVIVNLDKAPRNKRGRVEYRSDFCILKPADMARGNGKIFYDAPNRGSKRIVSFLNDAPAANDPSTLEDAGNGFLMRQGYTIVWCGWQGDLMPQKNWLVLSVPSRQTTANRSSGRSAPRSSSRKKESNRSRSAATSASRATKRRRATRPKLCSPYGKNPTDNVFPSICRMGIRLCVKDSRSGKEIDQAEQRRALSSLRLQTRPHLRIDLSGKESAGARFGLCRRTRPYFFLALRNEGHER